MGGAGTILAAEGLVGIRSVRSSTFALCRVCNCSSTMNITRLRQPIVAVKAQWLVLGIFENETAPPDGLADAGLGATIGRLRSEKELTGTLGELTPLYEPSGLEVGALLPIGLRPRDRFDAAAR